jgi:hypothetical protein
MTREKRSLSETFGEENAPLNRNISNTAESGSSEDAAGLLLHLSHSHDHMHDKLTHRATLSRSANKRQPKERTTTNDASSSGYESSRREGLLHPIGRLGFPHISDDKHKCEQKSSWRHVHFQSSRSAQRNNQPTAGALVRPTEISKGSGGGGGGGDRPPVAMALSPPLSLPKVECGSIIRDMHHTHSEVS